MDWDNPWLPSICATIRATSRCERRRSRRRSSRRPRARVVLRRSSRVERVERACPPRNLAILRYCLALRGLRPTAARSPSRELARSTRPRRTRQRISISNGGIEPPVATRAARTASLRAHASHATRVGIPGQSLARQGVGARAGAILPGSIGSIAKGRAETPCKPSSRTATISAPSPARRYHRRDCPAAAVDRSLVP